MKAIKKTAEYTVFERKDKRYAVQSNKRKAINGEEKINILIAEGLREAPKPKPAEPEAAAEESTDAAE